MSAPPCPECGHPADYHSRSCSAFAEALVRSRAAALASEAEPERRRNHHEVLCLVLKELLREPHGKTEREDAVQLARAYADLAYPPPKAEGT